MAANPQLSIALTLIDGRNRERHSVDRLQNEGPSYHGIPSVFKKDNLLLRVFVAAVGLALLIPGPVALIAPDAAASAFGIPADTSAARAFLVAMSVRDVSLGIVLLSLLRLKARSRELAAAVLAVAMVAAGDAATVAYTSGQSSVAAILTHSSGLVFLLILGWRLWVRPA